MFGESESESPRVPSPWESLISSSPSPSVLSSTNPSPTRSSPIPCTNLLGLHGGTLQPHDENNTSVNQSALIPAPPPVLHACILPSLVPEVESGNVEYKLHLLSPSSSRFARLVTQLKWRLLEGGGQAYYELGVADSGALVGLSRAEMEMTLETLEMMAGEIGASVIVVKEIEVPEAMVEAVKAQQAAGMLLAEEKWARKCKKGITGGFRPGASDVEEESTTMTTEHVETDGDLGDETEEKDVFCLELIVKDDSMADATVFAMDPEPDAAEIADSEQESEGVQMQSVVVDLEIFTVFKPRPVRTRMQSALLLSQTGKNKRQKKQYKPAFSKPASQPSENWKRNKGDDSTTKASNDGGPSRRQRKRNKTIGKPTLMMTGSSSSSSQSLSSSSPSPTPELTSTTALTTPDEVDIGSLVPDVAALQVSSGTKHNNNEVDTSADVVCMVQPDVMIVPPTPVSGTSEIDGILDPEGDKQLEVDVNDDDDDDVFPAITRTDDKEVGTNTGQVEDGKRLIVEALVVRKMSLEEAYLDFGGFG